jgi:hypothetical protein
MIPGFNHNIKHKGRVFHVQTEDSGPKNPHIITHLFVGGNIVSSKKTQYADLVGKPDYEKTVKSMMEEQHKQMLRNLVNGAFDAVEVATAYHLDGPAPMNYTAVSPTTNAMAGGSAFKGLPSQLKAEAADLPTSSTGTMAGVGAPQQRTTSAPVPAAPAAPPAAAPAAPAPPPGALAALAAAAAPQPPTTAAAARATTANGITIPASTVPKTTTSSLPGVGAPPVSAPPVSAVPVAAPTPARPTTIFGEDLISEKSLDEVILSYLAEDLADLE